MPPCIQTKLSHEELMECIVWLVERDRSGQWRQPTEDARDARMATLVKCVLQQTCPQQTSAVQRIPQPPPRSRSRLGNPPLSLPADDTEPETSSRSHEQLSVGVSVQQDESLGQTVGHVSGVPTTSPMASDAKGSTAPNFPGFLLTTLDCGSNVSLASPTPAENWRELLEDESLPLPGRHVSPPEVPSRWSCGDLSQMILTPLDDPAAGGHASSSLLQYHSVKQRPASRPPPNHQLPESENVDKATGSGRGKAQIVHPRYDIRQSSISSHHRVQPLARPVAGFPGVFVLPTTSESLRSDDVASRRSSADSPHVASRRSSADSPQWLIPSDDDNVLIGQSGERMPPRQQEEAHVPHLAQRQQLRDHLRQVAKKFSDAPSETLEFARNSPDIYLSNIEDCG